MPRPGVGLAKRALAKKWDPGKFFLMSVANRNSGGKGKKLKRRRERLVGPLVGPQPENITTSWTTQGNMMYARSPLFNPGGGTQKLPFQETRYSHG